MQLTCTQGNLSAALGVASRVVPTKSTLPVLANVLLIAKDGSLRVIANNLEMAVDTRVEANVQTEGTVTLPARLLADYTVLMDKGGKIDLKLTPKTLKMHLECGHFEANIAGIDAEDFPPVPTISGTTVTLPAKTLKAALEAVTFAAAPDDTRPVLAGVLLRIAGDVLTVAAADGFRLGVVSVALPEGGPDMAAIIPATAMAELARLLPDGDTDVVEIVAGGSYVHFSSGATSLSTRTIDGQYPDYQRIIPPASTTTVTLSRTDLLQMTKAASVFARDNSHIVRLEVEPNQDQNLLGALRVKSTSAEMGDHDGNLDADIEGAAVQIAFNARYVRDCLEALDSAQVEIGLTGSGSPGTFKPVASSTDILYVIMPMHVGAR
jgi:DNA polymerase III subunit beta